MSTSTTVGLVGGRVDWLNYHHLFYFWRIAREGSLSRAAEQLRLTHSTLSAQLKALEESLGDQLFERRGRRLVLTPLGEQVASYADEIFRLGGELLDAARGASASHRVTLRIGVPSGLPRTVAYRLFKPALELPQYRPLVIRQGSLDRLLEELAGGRLHMILSDAAPPAASSHRAFAHLLGASGILLYGVPQLARQLRREFPRSLEGVPMLLPAPPSSLRRQIDRWFVERGVRVTVEGEFEDAALMRTVGLHGHGVFPVREALKAEVEDAGRVEQIGKLDGVEERYYVVSPERRVRHPAVSAVVERARKALSSTRRAHHRDRD